MVSSKSSMSSGSKKKSDWTRRQFIGNTILGFAGSYLMLSCEKNTDITPDYDYGPNNCYKRLFNALNNQKWHFSPPENETASGEKFLPVLLFFQAMFRYPDNQPLLEHEFNTYYHSTFNSIKQISPDVLAMVFSCLGDKDNKKTAQEILDEFKTTYPSEFTMSLQDMEDTLEGFFDTFGLTYKTGSGANTKYSSYSFVYGMGDANYASIMGSLFGAGEKNSEWGVRFWNILENYMFGDSMAAKVFNCWDPVKYRIIPVQLGSDNAPGTELFEAFVANIPLHPFDVIEDFLHNNEITNWKGYQCGCMAMKMQKDGDKAKFAGWFANNKFDVSLRQADNSTSEFPTIDDGLTQCLADAEDHYLPHVVYNIKKSDETGYNTFMCHCHLNWCIELGPRNKYWGKQVGGEAPGITATSVQRGLYVVTVKPNACGDCHACYNTEPLNAIETEQLFMCPAGAISLAEKGGIKIDAKRCFGCLQCVRNCYRVKQSDDIALQVTRMNGQEFRIPESPQKMEEMRDITAPYLNWTHFRYDV